MTTVEGWQDSSQVAETGEQHREGGGQKQDYFYSYSYSFLCWEGKIKSFHVTCPIKMHRLYEPELDWQRYTLI